MGFDGVCYGWVPMVWVCCESRSGFAAASCKERGLLFFLFFFLVVLMVEEGGILQIFSGGS